MNGVRFLEEWVDEEEGETGSMESLSSSSLYRHQRNGVVVGGVAA